MDEYTPGTTQALRRTNELQNEARERAERQDKEAEDDAEA